MKRFFKFFPAALTVFALASCSDFDSLDENVAYSTSQKGDLIVEVENFDNYSSTRALRDADGNNLTFVNTDKINVYDEELYKYDVYQFNNDAFYLSGDKILTTMKYGLFPGDAVIRGYFDRGSKKTVAEFAIPHVIKYDADAEQKVDGKMLYAANLPMFGLASDNGTKVKVSKLRHLCAVLQIKLENIQDNCTYLRLSANKPLSGTFLAELDASSDEARKAVALKKGKDDLVTFNEMYIDLTKIPSRTGIMYIPVIPGYEANKVALKLEYTTDEPADVVAADAVGAVTWIATGLNFPKEKFEPNKLSFANWAFQLTDMTPGKISNLLDKYKGSEETIEFELADYFTIGIGTNVINGTPDNTREIKVPALNEGVNVNITLGEDFDEWACDGSAGEELQIVDADPAKPFKGVFTLNIGDGFQNATLNEATDLIIDLPEAEVRLVGDYASGTAWFATTGLVVKSAKKLTLGDATVAPTANELKVGTNFKTLITPTKFQLGDAGDETVVPEVEIAKYTKFDASGFGGIIDGVAAAPSVIPVDFALTINGEYVGDIDLNETFGAELNVTSDFGYFDVTNYAAGKTEKIAIDGDVATGGDITIALGSEGEAISGTLTMTGAKSDINLVQGYVNEIAADIANNGEWENYRYVNLNMNATNQGRVAFLALTENDETTGTNDGGYFVVSESTWDGNKISDVTYTSGNNYYDAFTTFTELDKETKTQKAADALTIFTASQMASFKFVNTTGTWKLSNNLDLKEKPNWAGYQVKSTFDGQNHTIKNLCLAGAGAGLFTSPSAAFTVKNLTIDGVKIKSAAEGSKVGGLFATAAQNVTAEKLTISNVDINNGGSKKLEEVGGLIGELTAGTVKLTDVYVSGSIQGYSNLGGLVGCVTGGNFNAAGGKFSATVAVTNNWKTGKQLDMALARIGGWIGSSTVNLSFAAPKAQPTEPTHPYSDWEVMSDINAETGDLVYYTKQQNYIGFCGQKAKGAPIATPISFGVGTKTYYASPTGYAATVATANAAGVPTNFGTNQASLYTVIAK